MNPILEALLGNTPLPDRESEVLKKALSDNLVSLRSQELMVQHFAIEAIRGMHETERLALIKRIGCGPRPAHHLAKWEVAPGLHSGSPMIKGTCGRCGNSCYFTGTPAAASITVWAHCPVGPSPIPQSIVEEYAAKYGFTG